MKKGLKELFLKLIQSLKESTNTSDLNKISSINSKTFTDFAK